ncbi:MAG: DnaA regulatory inactivator Hda [Coxiellaceae bacterium]|nr:MAG: DnaA regulatory inactivator Hda [Coxiellaceae bacterium]
MIAQLPLPVQLREDTTFHNFYEGDNKAVINFLEQFLSSSQQQDVFLWGGLGAGRSHLLQACCHALSQQQQMVFYLSLATPQLTPDSIENLEAFQLVCLDDIDAVMGHKEWEVALFHLYNRLHSVSGGKLLFAASMPPRQLPCVLADLQSRLAASVVFQVVPLNDEQKVFALQKRAQLRGLELSPEVAKFLLAHYSRDMVLLFSSLAILDRASLAAQRRLTVPFVKATLAA